MNNKSQLQQVEEAVRREREFLNYALEHTDTGDPIFQHISCALFELKRVSAFIQGVKEGVYEK